MTTARAPGLLILDAETVRRELTDEACFGLMREAMIALSGGQARQPLRQIIALAHGAFGVMPGALGPGRAFGAKLASIFHDPASPGRAAHQGVVAIFDPETGAPVCIADAGEVTAIRTAAASAVATDVLARPDARRMAILGYGLQALTHARAIARIRDLDEIRIWGRDLAKAEAFAAQLAQAGLPAAASPTVEAAADGADIVCTVTAAQSPILHAAAVAPGAHVNVVGSSRAGPVEIDIELVAKSRFIADHRASVVEQGTEFMQARAAGLIDEADVAEIGEVLAGTRPGRTGPSEITVYKSLGSIVQDLVSVEYLFRQAARRGFGVRTAF